jgi:hypothetical protein
MTRAEATAQLADLQRKPLAATLRTGEGPRKKFADEDVCRAIGRAIERALNLAGMQKGEAAFEMGYGQNQAPLSRWIAGEDTPQLARLFAVARLRGPLVIALAEYCGSKIAEDVEVITEIRVRRRRTA